MIETIKIGNKDIEMTATAATPMHYRNCFGGRDIMIEFDALNQDDSAMDFGIIERLAYVMSGAFKEKVSLEEWLEQFGPMDVVNAMEDIVSLYTGNIETQSESKNVETAEADS